MTQQIFINATQHVATTSQVEAGVVDMPPASRAALKLLLDFSDIPTKNEISRRALEMAAFIEKEIGALRAKGESEDVAYCAMIGGAPFFMEPLSKSLRKRGITPFFAFSVRESVETQNPDGSVSKSARFVHLGMVEAVDE